MRDRPQFLKRPLQYCAIETGMYEHDASLYNAADLYDAHAAHEVHGDPAMRARVVDGEQGGEAAGAEQGSDGASD